MCTLITMEALNATYSALLIVLSFVVVLVAAFTGLSLTKGISTKTMFEKKVAIALAAITLGGGVWAMHFLAMLGLHSPILFFYDAAITLISALSAILIVGVALILLHFSERTNTIILSAGCIFGTAILVMHYIGMAGIEPWKPVYSMIGIAVPSFFSICLCVLTVWIAYGNRNDRNILLGTICFAIAVSSVHFLAMAGTNFVAVPNTAKFGPHISNETLAIVLISFSFMIFGACLWVSASFVSSLGQNVSTSKSPGTKPPVQIPCERDNGKVFIAACDVLFVRADGHYTQIYTANERLFCAWPVTEAAKRLMTVGFLQTHRSYLVNPEKVIRIERDRDKGRCVFDGVNLPPAPVSRSKLKTVQDTLATNFYAFGAN